MAIEIDTRMDPDRILNLESEVQDLRAEIHGLRCELAEALDLNLGLMRQVAKLESSVRQSKCPREIALEEKIVQMEKGQHASSRY